MHALLYVYASYFFFARSKRVVDSLQSNQSFDPPPQTVRRCTMLVAPAPQHIGGASNYRQSLAYSRCAYGRIYEEGRKIFIMLAGCCKRVKYYYWNSCNKILMV